MWPSSTPGGERPASARSGAGLGPTGASLAERKENGPARKAAASADGAYASFRLPIRRVVSPKTSSGERCEKQAGQRLGVAGASSAGSPRPAEPVVAGFLPFSTTKKSGVGLEALGSRPGSETRNFPAASHFSGCHRRGQRKDEEKIWQKKI